MILSVKCRPDPFAVVIVAVLLFGLSGFGREIRLPEDAPLAGQVVIADWFYKQEGDELVPREFQAWPGKGGMRSADWFDGRIKANRGDVIVLAPGLYKADLWVFTPGLTITTEAAAEALGEIWGTVEIDADNVTLDRIAVVGPRKEDSSGHGIEVNREVVNRVAIRNCRIEENEWMGIHIIGPRGEIGELRVEDCQILENGSFGIEAQSVKRLVITGCTITANSEGLHIGSYVETVEMHDNVIAGNRDADVTRKE